MPLIHEHQTKARKKKTKETIGGKTGISILELSMGLKNEGGRPGVGRSSRSERKKGIRKGGKKSGPKRSQQDGHDTERKRVAGKDKDLTRPIQREKREGGDQGDTDFHKTEKDKMSKTKCPPRRESHRSEASLGKARERRATMRGEGGLEGEKKPP